MHIVSLSGGYRGAIWLMATYINDIEDILPIIYGYTYGLFVQNT